jgi:drug/metabolite transporter (DMT)-like permease
MRTYVTAILTMILMSFGQVLLKSLALKLGHWPRQPLNFLRLGVSVSAIYVAVLICWLYVLKSVDLNRAFAFVALTFVFVPFFSYFILHEKITIGTLAGSTLIICGILSVYL